MPITPQVFDDDILQTDSGAIAGTSDCCCTVPTCSWSTCITSKAFNNSAPRIIFTFTDMDPTEYFLGINTDGICYSYPHDARYSRTKQKTYNTYTFYTYVWYSKTFEATQKWGLLCTNFRRFTMFISYLYKTSQGYLTSKFHSAYIRNNPNAVGYEFNECQQFYDKNTTTTYTYSRLTNTGGFTGLVYPVSDPATISYDNADLNSHGFFQTITMADGGVVSWQPYSGDW